MINLERRKRILDTLAECGTMKTVDLSEKLGVTGATIRADLRDLAREGAIVRFHGGVKLPSYDKQNEYTENYMVRSITHVDKKTAIGRLAAELVSNSTTIFMDASSTTYQMIPFLKYTKDVTVVTNGIYTAMELQHHDNFKSTILIGGMLRPHSGSIEGIVSREMVSRLSGEYYFVSGNGFSVEEGLTGNSFFELELKRMCAERCRHIVALVDSTKISNNAASSFIATNKIDILITDSDADAETIERCRDMGVKVVVAEL